MKTKFFSMLFVATALMFTACENETETGGETGGDGDVTITLDQESVILSEGETATLVATVSPEGTEVVWTSSNEEFVTVDQDGVVTGVAFGSAFVYATAGGQVANCVVTVKEDLANKEYPSLEGTEYYPIILDSYTAEELADRIVTDFRPNDDDRLIYIWANGETYSAGTATGNNFYGNTDGYFAMIVAGANTTWSGGGFYVSTTSDIDDLYAKIYASPEDYYFHVAMKSTDNYSHYLSVLGHGCVVFGIGSTPPDSHASSADFTRDGEWHEMEFCFADFITDLDGYTESPEYILTFGSGGVAGTQLNLDAAFIYKK